jgi:hypothetical protein
MKNHLSLSLCVLSLFLASGSQSFAHEGHHHDGMGMGNGACAEDMKKLCGDVKKDDHGGMMKCMKEKQDKISDACKTQHTQMKSKMAPMMGEMMTACKSDMDTLCKDVKADDHHAMHECMMKNQDKLSPSCQAAHAKMMQGWKDHKGMAPSDSK